MLPGSLESLSFDEFERLVAAGLSEGRTLEFKQTAVGGRDEDKREFAADVSAFANSLGGDIVFGIEDIEGYAKNIYGLSIADRDAEIRRLDAILRTGLEPRLLNYEFKWLDRGDQPVLVCRVPRSYSSPHRVTLRGHDKFYARNSAGKYPMDVAEIRAAVLSGDALVQNVRNFRLERLALLEVGEGAIPLRAGALAVLHLIPLASLSSAYDVEVGDYESGIQPPSARSGWNSHYTLEGHASYSPVDPSTGATDSYALLFRSGIIEGALTVGAALPTGEPYIAASNVEWSLLCAYANYRNRYRRLGIQAPIHILLSLINCRNYRLSYAASPGARSLLYPRDRMMIPGLTIENTETDPAVALRPLFNFMWNGFGFSRALTFDDENKYIGASW